MDDKIIRKTPDQLGYKDRGKMKWLGLMLSDHTEALQNMAEAEKEYEVKAKPKQSLAEIGEILAEAYHMKKPVVIQANILSNGSYFKDVPCLVSGVFEEKIYLLLKDKRMVDTTLEDIRNIEFLDSNIWYEKK
jgi:hypothetical protein